MMRFVQRPFVIKPLHTTQPVIIDIFPTPHQPQHPASFTQLTPLLLPPGLP